MIGHDNPGEQSVSIAVGVQECVLDDPGTTRLTQYAGTEPAVEKVVDSFAPLHSVRGGWQRRDLALHALDSRARQRVREVEGDVLDQTLAAEMRHVASGVPLLMGMSVAFHCSLAILVRMHR